MARKKKPRLEGEKRAPKDMVPVVLPDDPIPERSLAEAADGPDPAIEREVTALAASSPAVHYSRIEAREQLEQVEWMVQDNIPVDQIKRVLRQKWARLTRERVLKLIERVREKWAVEDNATKPLAKSAAIRRTAAIGILARGEKDAGGNWVREPNLKAALEVERVLMDLQGTKTPIEVDHNVRYTQAMVAVIGRLDGEEAAELLAEALEEGELAQTARALLPPKKS